MPSSKILAQRHVRQREEEEVDEEVGSDNNRDELPKRVEGGPRRQQGSDRHGVARHHAIRDLSPFLPPLGQLELLVCVRRVVEPLPSEDVKRDQQILEYEGDGTVTNVHGIVFDKIGILDLGETVVMAVVVFDIPCLGHHPVEPVAHAAPGPAEGKLEPIPPLLVGVDPVVSAVARVVRHHGPPGERERAQRKDREEVDAVSHRGEPDKGTHVAPHDHLLQVGDIGGALLLLELIAELLDIGGECVVVEGLDPLVAASELGFRAGGLGRDAHCRVEERPGLG
mmetsp:Transcript_7581/g.17711  ORF Transcript_7581/g.17711 Transcript_7581/m.17711 type:complete len:282 (-) Transcript_7581:124-969(-)